MASTYTANQGIEKMDTGDQSGTWGGTVNTNMDIIDRAISGVGALTLTGSTTTLTTTDGTLTDGMYRVLVLGDGGDLGSDNTITLSPNDQDKAYLVYNNLSANRNAIFSQGTGANATVQNGETAWIYADGAGSGAAVRTAVSSVKITDQDGDTQIQVEEGGDDDDTIRFDVAGAEDFTMTANTFNVLSGSTLDVNSGATITNNGTATGFGADAERAFAGVLQTNSNFIDQVIFGPSVDGMPWNGLWNKASLFSSLMLATLEDEGSNAEINIWDLTEQSSGAPSTTPLATIDLSNVEAPSSIAASMGYLIIGNSSTDVVGFAIVDPHSGAWAERTKGWPKTLSASTSPALTSNDVDAVAAGFSDQPAFDPRTGGPMPTFGIGYGTGADIASLVKDDGNVWDRSGTVGNNGVGFINGHFVYANNDAQDGLLVTTMVISNITADDWDAQRALRDDGGSFGLVADNAFSVPREYLASASSSGLNSLLYMDYFTGAAGINAITTRVYTTGYMVGDIRGAWLANSKTVDRSYKANTLTENGTVTEGVVETSAELNGYSGWSTSNYLRRAHDTDLDFGTGDFSTSIWLKFTSSSANEYVYHIARPAAGDTVGKIALYLGSDSKLSFYLHNSVSGGAADYANSPFVNDDSLWHHVVCVRDSGKYDTAGNLGKLFMYIDGVLVATDVGPLTSGTMTDASATLSIGVSSSTDTPATTGTFALFRISATVPTPTQVREMYDAEKGMFVASAECLLQSGTTDAVIDVDVDPLSDKVLVTQTDAITIFDGLVVDSKPTVNSGASEKGKLWGDLRTEQNSANAYVTAPAVDQRQVNEMVRGLANEMPAGVDITKAKAWISIDGTGTVAIHSSFNIESIADNGTGQYYIYFATPFKNDDYIAVATPGLSNCLVANIANISTYRCRVLIMTTTDGNGQDTDPIFVVFFGELDNE
jgi:hypothetical protein